MIRPNSVLKAALLATTALAALAISHAAQPDQQVSVTTLDRLPSAEPGPAPVLLLAGWVFKDVRVDAPEFRPVLRDLIEAGLHLEA